MKRLKSHGCLTAMAYMTLVVSTPTLAQNANVEATHELAGKRFASRSSAGVVVLELLPDQTTRMRFSGNDGGHAWLTGHWSAKGDRLRVWQSAPDYHMKYAEWNAGGPIVGAYLKEKTRAKVKDYIARQCPWTQPEPPKMTAAELAAEAEKAAISAANAAMEAGDSQQSFIEQLDNETLGVDQVIATLPVIKTADDVETANSKLRTWSFAMYYLGAKQPSNRITALSNRMAEGLAAQRVTAGLVFDAWAKAGSAHRDALREESDRATALALAAKGTPREQTTVAAARSAFAVWQDTHDTFVAREREVYPEIAEAEADATPAVCKPGEEARRAWTSAAIKDDCVVLFPDDWEQEQLRLDPHGRYGPVPPEVTLVAVDGRRGMAKQETPGIYAGSIAGNPVLDRIEHASTQHGKRVVESYPSGFRCAGMHVPGKMKSNDSKVVTEFRITPNALIEQRAGVDGSTILLLEQDVNLKSN